MYSTSVNQLADSEQIFQIVNWCFSSKYIAFHIVSKHYFRGVDADLQINIGRDFVTLLVSAVYDFITLSINACT